MALCTTACTDAVRDLTNLATFTLPALETAGLACFKNSPNMNFFNGVNNNVCPLLTSIGANCWEGNTATPYFVVMSAIPIPNDCFKNCSATVISLPNCTSLGLTTGDNSVFSGCTNLTKVYVPTALATVDGGNPDGDLVYAVGTLGATINYI